MSTALFSRRRPRRRRRRRHGRGGSPSTAGSGFSDVLFDCTGDVPGTEAFTGGPRRRARVAMLSNPEATPVGPGADQARAGARRRRPAAGPRGPGLGRARDLRDLPPRARRLRRPRPPRRAPARRSLMAPLEGVGDAERRVARHRLRRRPVGRQARADRVDGALEVAARRAARGGREPRRLRRRGHRREPRVLRDARASARCSSSRRSSSSRWRPGTTGSCPTSTW